MITAMKAGVKAQRMLAILTVAAVFAASPARAQQWEDSNVGAPAQNAEPPESAAPAPAPSAPAGEQYIDTDPSALTDFRPALDPHGRWVNDPTYGVVWVPNESEVGRDFAPYVTNGYWAQTAEGDWIWVSSYPFGWVVFHYGRWVWITGTGWAWIPGRQYAPAWVVWRVPTSDYAYIGWAPMPPSYVWVDGAAFTLWFTAPAPYVFCHSHYFFHHHVDHYIIHDHRHVTYIAGRTRVYRPGSHGGRWRANPTVTDARVPPSSVPRGRTPADPRAIAASRRQLSGRTTTGPAATQTRRFSSSRSLGTTSPAPASSPYGRSAAPGSAPGYSASRPATSYSAVRPAPGYSAPAPASAWRGAAPAGGAPSARSAPNTGASRPRTLTAPSAPAAGSPPPARISTSSPSSTAGAPRSSWSSSSGSAPRSSWSSPSRSSWGSSSPRSSWSSPRSSWSPSRSPAMGSRSAPSRIRR
jgi:hypothetical protein